MMLIVFSASANDTKIKQDTSEKSVDSVTLNNDSTVASITDVSQCFSLDRFKEVKCIEIGISLLSVLGIMSLTFAALYLSRIVARSELESRITDSLNTLSSIAIPSDNVLQCLNNILPDEEEPFASDKLDDIRERYLAFMYLNIAQQVYFARNNKLLSEKYRVDSEKGVLTRLLSKDWVWHLLYNRGYNPDFVKHCERLIEDYNKTKENSSATSSQNGSQE